MRAILLTSLFLFAFSVGAEFKVPALKAPVNDYANVLSRNNENLINRALHSLKNQTGIQIAVLTVRDLGGEAIESASIKTTDRWKLGQEKTDQGVLLLIAMKERRLRIEVGQGLEGLLTDAYSSRIINQQMVPLIKSGRIDDAVLLGTYGIVQKTALGIDAKALFGSKQGKRLQRYEKKKTSPGKIIFHLIVMILMLIFIGPRNMMWLMIGSAMGGGRRSGGFGGGGGFGGYSGGGGGFSGGGASGGW